MSDLDKAREYLKFRLGVISYSDDSANKTMSAIESLIRAVIAEQKPVESPRFADTIIGEYCNHGKRWEYYCAPCSKEYANRMAEENIRDSDAPHGFPLHD